MTLAVKVALNPNTTNHSTFQPIEICYNWNFGQVMVNLLPDMPISCSSNLAANKDMMSKIWTNDDTII